MLFCLLEGKLCARSDDVTQMEFVHHAACVVTYIDTGCKVEHEVKHHQSLGVKVTVHVLHTEADL